VGGSEAPQHRVGEGESIDYRKRSVLTDVLGQGLTRGELESDPGQGFPFGVVQTHVAYRDDIRMPDTCRRSRLPKKRFPKPWCSRQFRVKHLQRDGFARADVDGGEDRGRSPGAKQRASPIPLGDKADDVVAHGIRAA